MTQLAEEGWLAPERPGPSRRHAAVLLLSSLAALAAWAAFATGRGADTKRFVVSVNGRAEAELLRAGNDESLGALERTVRMSGDTRFVVFDGSVPVEQGARVRVELAAASGIDRERIALRVLQPDLRGDSARIVVTMAASLLPGAAAGTDPAGPLSDLTAPLDEQFDAQRADHSRLRQMRAAWWWIVPLGVVLVAAGLWLWRRASRRFLSMRRPGPGKELDAAPPSSLDPISAAVLLAGVRPVDERAAFAGHVLDLVERRQLRLRRNVNPAVGELGAQLGLAHADAAGPGEDPALAVLRSTAQADGLTVDLPEDAARVRRADAHVWRDWCRHVAARARFERMVETWPWRRVSALAAAVAAFGVLGVVGALLTDRAGDRATAWLVAALCLPLAAALASWAIDARRWRVVARRRRTERAQWLAWRARLGAADGQDFDQRNLPLAAATGPVDALVPDQPPADAVALDAVSAGTVRALRAVTN